MGQAFTHCCACGFRPLDGNGQQWSTVLASKRQQNELCFSAQKTWKRRTKRNATVELTVRGYKLLNSAVDGTTPTTVPGQHGDVGTDKLRLVTVKSDHLAVVWMLFVGLWRTNLVSSRTNFYHPSVPHRPPIYASICSPFFLMSNSGQYSYLHEKDSAWYAKWKSLVALMLTAPRSGGGRRHQWLSGLVAAWESIGATDFMDLYISIF